MIPSVSARSAHGDEEEREFELRAPPHYALEVANVAGQMVGLFQAVHRRFLEDLPARTRSKQQQAW